MRLLSKLYLIIESPSESISSPLKEPFSILDELYNAIKKAILPRFPIRCETLSSEIQKEI